MKPVWKSSLYELWKRARVAAWWGRFRLSAGLGGLRAVAPVSNIDIRTPTERFEILETRSAFLGGAVKTPRIWRARLPATIDLPLNALADLCVPGPDGWRPWVLKAASYESPPLNFVRLRDAVLFVHAGAVMPRPWSILRDTRPHWLHLGKPLPGTVDMVDNIPQLRLAATRPTQIVDGPILSLCHAFGTNYGHWLLDGLPGLIPLLDLVSAGKLLVLSSPLETWKRQTLELLGIPASSIVEIEDDTVGVKELVCHSLGGRQHLARPSTLIVEVFERLGAATDRIAEGLRPARIYVSRRKVTWQRQFSVEQQLEEALGRLGFVTVHPEQLTLSEQIATFSRAEVIVGPHGSGLLNSGFAPRGCLVIEIVPEFMRPAATYGLVRQMSHHLIVVVAQRDPTDSPSEPKPHYSVDVADLVARVRAGMERLGIASR